LGNLTKGGRKRGLVGKGGDGREGERAQPRGKKRAISGQKPPSPQMNTSRGQWDPPRERLSVRGRLVREGIRGNICSRGKSIGLRKRLKVFPSKLKEEKQGSEVIVVWNKDETGEIEIQRNMKRRESVKGQRRSTQKNRQNRKRHLTR